MSLSRHSLQIGFGIPRGLGDPRGFTQPDHAWTLGYGKRAEELGFDSVWFPDHFHFERPPGTLTPFPEAWTLMTAVAAQTSRIRIGSMVLAAAFRHPALLAHMAMAFQEISGGRLLLGLGAGNQVHEHEQLGLGFDRRVGRFDEYLRALTGLLAGESVTLVGRHYTLRDATLLASAPPVPIWIAAGGDRTLDLTARYASGWNCAGAGGPDGALFKEKLATLRQACREHGRDPDEIEVSYSFTVLPVSDDAAANDLVEKLCEIPPGGTPEQIRERFVVGTPDQVAAALRRPLDWGVTHLICSLGAQPFTLWSDDTLDLFAREVLPRVRAD